MLTLPNSNLYSAAAALAVLTVLLIWAYWAIVRARAAARGLDMDRPLDRLAALREAYKQGQMDTGEFERIQISMQDSGGKAWVAGNQAKTGPPANVQEPVQDVSQPEALGPG
jgi:hypothetical protein